MGGLLTGTCAASGISSTFRDVLRLEPFQAVATTPQRFREVSMITAGPDGLAQQRWPEAEVGTTAATEGATSGLCSE
jgi:hypothetical protein